MLRMMTLFALAMLGLATPTDTGQAQDAEVRADWYRTFRALVLPDSPLRTVGFKPLEIAYSPDRACAEVPLSGLPCRRLSDLESALAEADEFWAAHDPTVEAWLAANATSEVQSVLARQLSVLVHETRAVLGRIDPNHPERRRPNDLWHRTILELGFDRLAIQAVLDEQVPTDKVLAEAMESGNPVAIGWLSLGFTHSYRLGQRIVDTCALADPDRGTILCKALSAEDEPYGKTRDHYQGQSVLWEGILVEIKAVFEADVNDPSTLAGSQGGDFSSHIFIETVFQPAADRILEYAEGDKAAEATRREMLSAINPTDPTAAPLAAEAERLFGLTEKYRRHMGLWGLQQ